MKKYITTILVMIATIIPLGFYIYNHPQQYTYSVVIISLALLLTIILFRNWRNSIYISPYILLSAILIMTYVLANAYANFYFYNYPFQAPIYKTTMIKFNIDFTKSLLLSTMILLLYVSSSYYLGTNILKKFKKHLGELTNLSYQFLSTVLGLSVYGSVFFVLASRGILNPITSYTALLIPIILNIKNVLFYLKKVVRYLSQEIEVELNIKKVVLIVPALLFICSFVIISLSAFITGPDGLRYYLTLTKHLADNGALPITKFTTYNPFLTEVLVSPAYMLGGISSTRFLLNFLSLSSIFGLYLIAKNHIKSKSDYFILFITFLFPSYLKIFASEFKVDIFLTLFTSIIFWSLYEFLKSKKNVFIYITSYFMGVALMVKLTSLYFVIPISVFILIQILSSKNKIKEKVKQLTIILLLGIIPALPWVTLYKVSLDRFTNIGLGLSNYSNESIVKKDIDQCLYNQKDHEEGKYFPGFENNLKGLVSLPYYYLKAGDNSIFSLLDSGAFFLFSVILYFSYLIIKRNQIIKDKNLQTISILTLVSWIIWIKTAPVYIWYIGPILILTTMIIYISFIKNGDTYIKNFIRLTTIAFGLIFTINFSTQFMFVNYFPTGIAPSEIVKIYQNTFDFRRMYYSQSNIAPFLNKDKNSYILFSSGTGFANIGYFIDKYLDRAIYLDLYTHTFSKEEISKIINDYNIQYVVINRVAVDSEIECLSKNQKIAVANILELGKIEYKTATFNLVKINK